jgi:hypothetical protein
MHRATAQARLLVEQPTGRQLDGGGEFFQRRDLRVAFAALDPADLPRLDAAALGDLFLGQADLSTALRK